MRSLCFLGRNDMIKEISERDFFLACQEDMEYIGIYELNWIMDSNLLDCAGIIVALENRKILVTSKTVGEDSFDFVYYEFLQEYECRKIISTADEPLCFVRKEPEDGGSRMLRFQIGKRPIIVLAYDEKWVDVGLSHWSTDDLWIDFDNYNLLNDQL